MAEETKKTMHHKLVAGISNMCDHRGDLYISSGGCLYVIRQGHKTAEQVYFEVIE